MKITFLGTSHGVPSAVRYSSSLMIEVDGSVYLVDGGAPVADLLTRRGVPFTSVRAVFATHMHSDHTGGFPLFFSLSNWYYKDTDYDIFLPDTVDVDAMRALLCAMDGGMDNEARLRFHPVREGVLYSDDRLTVTAYRTRHMMDDRTSYAYRLEAAGGPTLCVTGDLHHGDAADFPDAFRYEPSDAVVCEMAHFSLETALGVLAPCPTRQVFFTHIGPGNAGWIEGKIPPLPPLPFSLHVPDDGDSFEI
jgi:glyoxylase-like metal-dependent hydrolase (beta-lactamase superfamily II)